MCMQPVLNVYKHPLPGFEPYAASSILN